MVQAVHQANPQMKMYTAPGYVTAAAISSLGSAMNNVAGVSFAWTTTAASQAQHPAIKAFVTDLTKYAPSPNAPDVASTIAWADVRALIAGIWKVKGAITGANVIKALNSTTNYNPGVSPPISFSKPSTEPGYSRIFSPWVIEVKWNTAGQLRSIGKFFNFFTGKTLG
jgi:ABC-type branched-subunit amino acid transport system substrate-binding protein